jgi:hypothetical protein
MQTLHRVRAAEKFGRIRLSRTFFMRDFLYSEIANIHAMRNLPLVEFTQESEHSTMRYALQHQRRLAKLHGDIRQELVTNGCQGRRPPLVSLLAARCHYVSRSLRRPR